jgi:hypothetical protein
MNDDTLYSIGELARRTGLAVRTIRFYSDSGLVPPPTGARPASGAREKLVTRLEVASDPLTERYWLLLAAVNGTPVPPSLAPVFGCS